MSLCSGDWEGWSGSQPIPPPTVIKKSRAPPADTRSRQQQNSASQAGNQQEPQQPVRLRRTSAAAAAAVIAAVAAPDNLDEYEAEDCEVVSHNKRKIRSDDFRSNQMRSDPERDAPEPTAKRKRMSKAEHDHGGLQHRLSLDMDVQQQLRQPVTAPHRKQAGVRQQKRKAPRPVRGTRRPAWQVLDVN